MEDVVVVVVVVAAVMKAVLVGNGCLILFNSTQVEEMERSVKELKIGTSSEAMKDVKVA